MEKRFVYICSPLRGNMERNMEKACRYCREAVKAYPDVVPLAPHIYFTRFLDDEIPEERAIGLESGLSLLGLCSEIWVFGTGHPSEGMKGEIEYAMQHNIWVRNGYELLRRARQTDFFETFQEARELNRVFRKAGLSFRADEFLGEDKSPGIRLLATSPYTGAEEIGRFYSFKDVLACEKVKKYRHRFMGFLDNGSL